MKSVFALMVVSAVIPSVFADCVQCKGADGSCKNSTDPTKTVDPTPCTSGFHCGARKASDYDTTGAVELGCLSANENLVAFQMNAVCNAEYDHLPCKCIPMGLGLTLDPDLCKFVPPPKNNCPTCPSDKAAKCTWDEANANIKECVKFGGYCSQLGMGDNETYGCLPDWPGDCVEYYPYIPCRGRLLPTTTTTTKYTKGRSGTGSLSGGGGLSWILGAALASLGVIQLLYNL